METFFPLISSKEFPHWPIQNPLDNFSPSICFLIDWSRLFRLQSNGVIKLENVHLNNVIVSQNGISLTASDDKDPYSKLKGYFDHLMKVTPAKNMKAVFSPPYVDGWGLGKKAKNFDFTLVSRPHRQVLCLNTRHQIVADCMVVFHNTFFPFQSLFKLTKISLTSASVMFVFWRTCGRQETANFYNISFSVLQICNPNEIGAITHHSCVCLALTCAKHPVQFIDLY